MARNITVFPPIERYCFGPPAPARSPRPAATRMATLRRGLAIRPIIGDARLLGTPSAIAQSPYHAGDWKTRENKSPFHALPGKAGIAALHLQDDKNCLKCRHEA